MDEAQLRGVTPEQSSVGVGATEVVRRELSDYRVVDVVRAEATERLEAAAQLTAPAHVGGTNPRFFFAAARLNPCGQVSSAARKRLSWHVPEPEPARVGERPYPQGGQPPPIQRARPRPSISRRGSGSEALASSASRVKRDVVTMTA